MKVVIIGVKSISISFANEVESIQVTYGLSNGSLYTTPRRGGSKYKPVTIELAPDEFVEKIEGKTDGVCVNQMSIHITKVNKYERKIYGPFGTTGEKVFSFGDYLVGFYGEFGDTLTCIGGYSFYPVKQSEYVGANGTGIEPGVGFDENPNFLSPKPVAKISKIHIYSNDTVMGLQVEYLLYDGSTLVGGFHGSTIRATLTTITFDEAEVLTGIEGLVTEIGDHIQQMTFVTWIRGGSIGRHGPYGRTGYYRPFATYGSHILGFSGNAGYSLNGISVYYDEHKY